MSKIDTFRRAGLSVIAVCALSGVTVPAHGSEPSAPKAPHSVKDADKRPVPYYPLIRRTRFA